jgi:GNAT superfamily N-acetyltransferase
MRLEKVTAENLAVAMATARTIFPNEVHADGHWPELAYRESLAKPFPNFSYFLGYQGANLIGCTGFYPDEKQANVMWLGWFGVLPSFRRCGFGSVMLHETMWLLKDLELHLYVAADNASAQQFYRHNLFTQYAEGIVDKEAVFYFKRQL